MKKAVILAAGLGRRMEAVSAGRPKPMILVAGQPLLRHILDRLVAAAFTDLLVVVGHQREQIEEYFANYAPGLRFRIQEPVDGTGSATLLALDFVGNEPFLLTFGDILMDSQEYQSVRERLLADPEAAGCSGVRWEQDPCRGAAVYEDAGVVTRIVEKPVPGTSLTHWNSAGLYAFRPVIFVELARIERSPRGEYELTSAVSQLLERGIRILLHPIRGGWGDIGTPEDLNTAERLVSPSSAES